MIIPSNHPKYPFPLNLEDRIEYIKNAIQEKIPTSITIDIKDKKNGIFENVRSDKFIKYDIKIKSKPEWDMYKETFIKLGFVLEDNIWSKTIE